MTRWGWVLLLAWSLACGDDDVGADEDAAIPGDLGMRDAQSPPEDGAPQMDEGTPLECDEDGDGHDRELGSCGGDDCDDADPSIHPGASDDVGDGVDQSCDGIDGVDADGDDHASVGSGGDDCDDADATIHPGARDDPWIEELVVRDGAFSTARSMSSDVSSDGRFHVAFAVGGKVSYAVGRTGDLGAPGTWDDEVVEEVDRDLLPISTGAYVNLAVAADDTVHLLYTGITAARHAVKTAGGWDIETVDLAQVNHGARTMVVDGAGALHVVFELPVGDSSDLGYATNASGSWARHDLTTADDDGIVPSIAVGETGVPHVSHYDATNDRVVHSWREGGVWMSETIRSGVSPSGVSGLTSMSALALDAGGGIHAVFQSNREPVYLHRVGSEWTEAARLGGSRYGVFPELLVGPTGAVHAAFTGVNSSSEIRIGYATDELGVWADEVLPPPRARSSRVAASLDLAGNPTIFFANADDDNLAVIFRRNDGVDQNCDGIGD